MLTSVRFALNLSLLALLAGCYSIRQGQVLSTERLVGSERGVAEFFNLEVVSSPSVEEPYLTVRVVRMQRREYKAQDRHQAMRTRNGFLTFLGGLFVTGVGGGGITIGLQQTQDDTLTDGGKVLVGAGALAALGGVILIIQALDSSPQKPLPGRTVGGSVYTRTETIRGPVVANAPVTFTLGGHSTEQVTSSDGMAKIGLATDLGLADFSEPMIVNLRINTRNATQAVNVSLNTRDWTRPCARTRGVGLIFAEGDVSSEVLGDFGPGQRFWLRDDSSADWYHIVYGTSQGWIPQSLANLCWSVPNAPPDQHELLTASASGEIS